MTIRHLSIFIEVVKNNNMSKAAKKLYISQPSVSQSIKELEEYYGVILFERFNKKLSITEAGKKLYSYALDVVDQFDNLEKNMFELNNIEKIKIGATISIGDCILSEITNEFRKENPKVEIYSLVSNTEGIEEKLLNNKLDIGIVEGKIKSKDLIVCPELSDYLVLICSTNHPFAKRDTISLEELRHEKFALREKGSGTRQLFEDYMIKNGIPIRTVFEGNSPESIKREVINNNLISVISICLVEKEIMDSTIHVIENSEDDWNRHFCIVYHKDKLFNDRMKSLMKITEDYEHIPTAMNYKPGILVK